MALYEPVHGSAPDIAGHGLANPLATIASVAMMLRHSFALDREAQAIEQAIDRVLADGRRTSDISPRGGGVIGTTAMGVAVAEAI